MLVVDLIITQSVITINSFLHYISKKLPGTGRTKHWEY